MSGNKIIAIILVALIHVAVGYALVTGLAYSAVKKAIERVTTVDINEPPPPPPDTPPPRFTPKSPQPKGNPGSWQSPDDYPSRALREEREGVTGVSVSVSAEGRVAGCSVTRSSGSPDLDDAACRLITRRGRFNPATDGEGKPTSGTWNSSVRWQIPK
jgi:protein TonB